MNLNILLKISVIAYIWKKLDSSKLNTIKISFTCLFTLLNVTTKNLKLRVHFYFYPFL